ncbi:MAG: SLC13 family permease [Anaerolineae bacterium]|nr:SLC13 family permease [Anaerolineae bacterium]MCO5188959.1 SLC13 family permease [Anaerolineae bacterium]MCO5194798.1 SLC13 family permease [Anaerolineae bacterium]MCO5197633.1 SLC13 family permease [Anaerolineae bacterium]MCO5203745.1 SLC13 family permease [Anaerolineae bacterium]
MSTDNWLVLGILLVALALFISEVLRPDVVALLVLVATVVLGLVTVEQAFSGFASPAVVTVWAVFIVSGGLFKTGVADIIGRSMLSIAGTSYTRLLAMIMITAGAMSAFMNNIGAVAILLPAVMSISRETDIPPSKLLIPLAVASLLGGNITLIGTPPNLLAANIMFANGIEPFSFFDFAPTGIAVLTAGILYMLVIGRHLLPGRTGGAEIAEGYAAIRDYLTEVLVTAASPFAGKNVNAVRFGRKYDIAIVHVRRDNEILLQSSDRLIKPGDILLLEGHPDDIVVVSRSKGLQLMPDLASDQLDEELLGGEGDSAELVEVVLPPRSNFQGQTLRELNFRRRYGVTVLAIRHNGQPVVTHVVDVPLAFGDVLLIQGETGKFKTLRQNPNLMILERRPLQQYRLSRAPLAVAIVIVTLLAIIVGANVSIALLGGALAMVVGRCLTMEEAYQSVDWQSVFLIAGMLPLGIAMETTGTAALLANQLIALVGDTGPLAILIALFILTTLLTSVISNAAAAVLIIPIAIGAATAIDVTPQAFVMTSVIAASTAFLFPIGHQANIIVFGPGNYKFFDFTRVGIWLNLLLLVVVVITVPLIWPFN